MLKMDEAELAGTGLIAGEKAATVGIGGGSART
jgi:hypothetical protein